MSTLGLVLRSFKYFLKRDLVIAAGIAVAIAALTGSLLVGNSVKRNLEHSSLARLGNIQYTAVSKGFFLETLADRLRAEQNKENKGRSVEAVLVLPALVKKSTSETLVPDAVLTGVKESYWADSLKTVVLPDKRDAVLNEVLARDLKVHEGDYLVVKIAETGFAPGDSLFGGKNLEDTRRSFPVIVRTIVKNIPPADFSLKNEAVKPRNIFVRLDYLQEQIKKPGKVNCLLFFWDGLSPEESLRRSLEIEDLGLRIVLNKGYFVLESDNMVLPGAAVEAAEKAAKANWLSSEQTSVYLLNSINGKAPYSIVFGSSRLFSGKSGAGQPASALEPIILSSWAAEDTGVAVGDTVKTEYFSSGKNGEYELKTKQFLVINIEPQDAMAANAVVPKFEGMTDAGNMAGWKTPFPVELKKIRQKDELFWNSYRTAPKALIKFETAKKFWQPAYSGVTSIKILAPEKSDLSGFKKSFLKYFDYKDAGIRLTFVRAEALQAAQGSTDYSMLFISLSFIIVLSSLWLASYLFRIMLEARTAEAGLLRALGFPYRSLLKLYLAEGLLILVLGALLSLPVSYFYAKQMLLFLKPLLGEGTEFKLYFECRPVITGLLFGGLLSLFSIYWGIRVFKGGSVRGLLFGRAFYSGSVKKIKAGEISSLFSFGVRSIFYSKKRSLLTAGLFASAAFIIITVAVNRPRGFDFDTFEKKSGSGGFNLLARSKLALFNDLNNKAGRKSSGFLSYDSTVWDGVTFLGCKLSSSGDDVSCLNVNKPVMPRILGLPLTLVKKNGSNFSSGKKIDWAVLNQELPGGRIPAAADANSAQWILHKKSGDNISVYSAGGAPVELNFAVSLSRSIFAEALVISEENFSRIFGSDTGYNYFLVGTSKEKEEEVALLLRQELGRTGYTVTRTSELLAAFANVQNTYLYTFQILGGLGFLLGTFGIVAVLLQNVYERKQQFALLTALGFKKKTLVFLVAIENALLLLTGLFAGSLLSVLVSLPYILKTGNNLNFTLPLLTLSGMLLIGLVSCALAAYYALKGNLLLALRNE